MKLLLEGFKKIRFKEIIDAKRTEEINKRLTELTQDHLQEMNLDDNMPIMPPS